MQHAMYFYPDEYQDSIIDIEVVVVLIDKNPRRNIASWFRNGSANRYFGFSIYGNSWKIRVNIGWHSNVSTCVSTFKRV